MRTDRPDAPEVGEPVLTAAVMKSAQRPPVIHFFDPETYEQDETWSLNMEETYGIILPV